jgi:hypothetical protein
VFDSRIRGSFLMLLANKFAHEKRPLLSSFGYRAKDFSLLSKLSGTVFSDLA